MLFSPTSPGEVNTYSWMVGRAEHQGNITKQREACAVTNKEQPGVWPSWEKSPPHRPWHPKKAGENNVWLPRQCLPRQGEQGFSHHIRAFPSCPPVFVQEGDAAAGVEMITLDKPHVYEDSSSAHSKTEKPPPLAQPWAEMPKHFSLSLPGPTLHPILSPGFGWVCREAPGTEHHHQLLPLLFLLLQPSSKIYINVKFLKTLPV